jgi:hypothetical protein
MCIASICESSSIAKPCVATHVVRTWLPSESPLCAPNLRQTEYLKPSRIASLLALSSTHVVSTCGHMLFRNFQADAPPPEQTEISEATIASLLYA